MDDPILKFLKWVGIAFLLYFAIYLIFVWIPAGR